MPVEIKEVKVGEVAPKLKELYLSHWEEVANYKDNVPLDIDFGMLERLEKAEKLVGITVEENDEIIGYALFIVSTHLHYKSLVTAANDVLFLRKDKRDIGTGLRLIMKSMEILKSKGAMKVTFHVKPDHDFSPLLKRLGFLHEELIYGRLL